jgi:hypothetical protein
VATVTSGGLEFKGQNWIFKEIFEKQKYRYIEEITGKNEERNTIFEPRLL